MIQMRPGGGQSEKRLGLAASAGRMSCQQDDESTRHRRFLLSGLHLHKPGEACPEKAVLSNYNHNLYFDALDGPSEGPLAVSKLLAPIDTDTIKEL